MLACFPGRNLHLTLCLGRSHSDAPVNPLSDWRHFAGAGTLVLVVELGLSHYPHPNVLGAAGAKAALAARTAPGLP